MTALCLGCMAPDTGAAFCPHCGWERAANSASVLHLRPGTALRECYLVGRVLGQGGFGITYLGFDTQLQRKVAIKEYFPQVIASRVSGSSTVAPTSAQVHGDYQHGLQSFMTEGRILARFSDHPCIVSVLNLFEAHNTGYLIMGFLEGMTLSQGLGMAGGKYPYEVARDIMMRVMDGLREVHAQGLLHRDISPDNIYLTRQGPVKILDFGAARFEAGERSQSLSVVLKEGYAPEEQYRRSGHQGPWTDIYATGATLYRAITGMIPPPALDRLHSDTLQAPRQLGVPLPPQAEAALMRALAVRAGDRFQSVDTFQAALQPAVQPGPHVIPVPLPTPNPEPATKPRPKSGFNWKAALAAAGFLLLVIILIAAVNDKIQRDRIAEAQRLEEQRRRDEEDRQRQADEAAAAERARQAEAARQQEQQAVAAAQTASDQYDAWLVQRRQEMGSQSVTITFQNDCSSGPLTVAIRFKLPDNTGRWATDGWWQVDPGKTLIPKMATDNGNVYFWAKNATGTWDGSDDPNGSVTVPVVDNNFIHVDGTEIQGRNRQMVTMFHRFYDSWGNHTVSFTCTGK